MAHHYCAWQPPVLSFIYRHQLSLHFSLSWEVFPGMKQLFPCITYLRKLWSKITCNSSQLLEIYEYMNWYHNLASPAREKKSSYSLICSKIVCIHWVLSKCASRLSSSFPKNLGLKMTKVVQLWYTQGIGGTTGCCRGCCNICCCPSCPSFSGGCGFAPVLSIAISSHAI